MKISVTSEEFEDNINKFVLEKYNALTDEQKAYVLNWVGEALADELSNVIKDKSLLRAVCNMSRKAREELMQIINTGYHDEAMRKVMDRDEDSWDAIFADARYFIKAEVNNEK